MIALQHFPPSRAPAILRQIDPVKVPLAGMDIGKVLVQACKTAHVTLLLPSIGRSLLLGPLEIAGLPWCATIPGHRGQARLQRHTVCAVVGRRQPTVFWEAMYSGRPAESSRYGQRLVIFRSAQVPRFREGSCPVLPGVSVASTYAS